MELKVAPIKKVIFTEGVSAGTPCISVDCLSDKAEERNVDEVLSEILAFSKVRTVLVKGKISEMPELKVILMGLSSKGKAIIFVTPASEDISLIRMVRSLDIILVATPPTREQNNIKESNFGYLKNTDTIKFNVDSIESYNTAKDFVMMKSLKVPNINFSINKCKEPMEILKQYLEDCEQFLFETRITKKLF